MSYRISDSVAMRMIQIFQEAVLLGVDGADLMRQVRLVVDENSPNTVTLDPQYEKQVAEMHQKYLKESESLREKSENSSQKLLFES
jgi:CRISPR/Cas system-associated protein endoribonuclease Cas2